jgi:hypothetical protein
LILNACQEDKLQVVYDFVKNGKQRQSPKKSTVSSERDNETGDLDVVHSDIAAVANHDSNSYNSTEEGKTKRKQ